MRFTPETAVVHESPLGFEIQSEGALVFFGKRDATFEALLAGQGFRGKCEAWARIRQTHSDLVVKTEGPAPVARVEADAHFSQTPGLALLIATADCVPVMIHDPSAGVVAAIHAGWRGVAARIVPKTIRRLREECGSRQRDLRVFIGPHIQRDSFEVSRDVAESLLASVGADLAAAEFRQDLGGGKYLVDLNALVRAQLSAEVVAPDRVFALGLDTKTDTRFHSHRRDRELAGRQLSFIVQKLY